jgi:hypothetical protein
MVSSASSFKSVALGVIDAQSLELTLKVPVPTPRISRLPEKT